jgi:hypothetical protein
MINTVLAVSTVVASITTICGFLFSLYKIFRRFESLEDSNKCRKKENVILIRSTFAMLDGLHQLGANGEVTKARQELQDYIVQRGE